MKKNRIFGLAAAALLLGAAACSNDMIEPDKNHGGQLKPSDGSGGVYMTLDITMPGGATGTRSETLDPDDKVKNPDGYNSTGGVEVGSDAENFVSSALVVLASTEAKDTIIETSSDKTRIKIEKFGFIAAGEVPGNRISTLSPENGSKQYRAVAKLQQENLNSLYGLYELKDENGNLLHEEDGSIIYNVPEMYVFVFCNPTQELLTLFNGENTPFGSVDWIDKTCEVIQTVDASQSKNIGIWGTNSFLMNNVNLTKRELPKKLLDWEYYSSPTEAFHLSGKNDMTGVKNPVDNSKTAENPNRGSVLVERSVARFDFKDGSPLFEKAAEDEKDANVGRYNVLYSTKANGDFDDAKPIVDIKIQKMCLVNMCNKFYYVPRVSNNGLPELTVGENESNGFEYCGAEKPWERRGGEYFGGNYVVGPYANEFGGNAIMTGFQDYMNFSFFDENGKFNSDVISTTRWDVVKVSDVLKGRGDNYEGTGSNPTVIAQKGDYKVWRYV
ncbi:MAG: hypothetical protein K2J58_01230, partial [Muribaculaceae bacterium]|nr:hypothetical protein [Muribaculaceae bacterium]